MYRRTILLAVSVLVSAAFSFGQEPQLTPPQVPEDAMGARQLIAWSSVQKPQPAPQPLPSQDNQVPEPGQQPDQQAQPPADPHTEQAPAESFTGKIVKEEGKYVLKAGSTGSYLLEAKDDLSQFENQNVKIVGSLSSDRSTIRVLKIQLLS